MSEDPIGFEAGDVNLSRYVFNDPANLTDPSGQDVFWGVRDLDGVFIGNHGYLVIIPDKPEDFPSGRLVDLYGGKRGFTLGAHEGDDTKGEMEGCLIVIRNQKADIAAVRESNDPKRYEEEDNPDAYKSGWDFDENEISPPEGMTDTEFIKLLLKLSRFYQANNKKIKLQYDLSEENCQSWVNSILKQGGVSDDARAEAGEFDGVDWGEEDEIPEELFDEPPPPREEKRGKG